MTGTHLRIDPTIPYCWEDPDTLRFGFDAAEARIVHPSAATQRLLGGLLRGVAVAELAQASRRAGAGAAERDALLASLAPVLISYSPDDDLDARGVGAETFAARALEGPGRRAPLRVTVHGDGAPAEIMRLAVARAGFAKCRSPFDERPPAAFPSPRADLAIVIERFVGAPELPHRLLLLGIPHLLIRFTDRSIRIGPIVGRSGAPCVNCVTQHDIDADPAIPVLAAQLIDRVPASESGPNAELASSLGLALVHHWMTGESWPRRTRLSLSVSHGLPETTARSEPVHTHDGCGCAPAHQGLGDPSAQPATVRPASERNLEGVRRLRPPPAVPEMRSASRARVKAT